MPKEPSYKRPYIFYVVESRYKVVQAYSIQHAQKLIVEDLKENSNTNHWVFERELISKGELLKGITDIK